MAKYSARRYPVLPGLFLFLGFLSCAGPPEGPYLLHPVPPGAERFSLRQGAVVFDGPGFSVALRPIDWRFVGQCYRDAGMSPPFGGEEASSRFLFFSLRFENGSSGTLYYNPRWTGLRAGGAAVRSPVEVSDVYRLAAGTEDLEARTRSFVKTSYDGSEEIAPGEVTERYLVFRSPRDRFESVEVLLEDLYLGAESFDLAFVFEAFPAGEQDF